MLSAGRQRNRWPAVLRRPEAAVDAGGDRPGSDAYVYALTDEAAYLQAEDEKPAVIARPPPDPAQFKCWFCRKPHQQVQRLFGAEASP
jgi:hypothetical protein